MSVVVRKVDDKKSPIPAPRLHGGTPDTELEISPRWIIFSSADGYRKPQLCDFTITNVEREPVVYRLRTKNRGMPSLSHTHGYLQAGESVTVTVILSTAMKWSRDPTEIAGRRHRVLCESLTVAELQPPVSDKYTVDWVRDIFHHTASDRPFTRIYAKLNIFLPKVTDEWIMVPV